MNFHKTISISAHRGQLTVQRANPANRVKGILSGALLAVSALSAVACSDAQGPHVAEPVDVSDVAIDNAGDAEESAGEAIESIGGPIESAAAPFERLYENAGVSMRLTNAEVVDDIEMPNGNHVLFVVGAELGTTVEYGPAGNAPSMAEIASQTDSLFEQFKLLAPNRPVPRALAPFADATAVDLVEPLQDFGAADESPLEAAEDDLGPAAVESDSGLHVTGLCSFGWFGSTHCGLTNSSGKTPKQFWLEEGKVNNSVKVPTVIPSSPGKAWEGRTVVCGDGGKVKGIVTVLDPTNVNLQAEVPGGIWWSSGTWMAKVECTRNRETCFRIQALAATQVQTLQTGSRYHWCGYFN
jgi:hypothetical protein